MTTRKRNEFLDIVSSDDEDNDRGYDSEAAEESKGRIFKRRKTQTRSKEVESNYEEEEDVGDVGDSEVSEIENSEEDSRLAKRREGRHRDNINKDESDEENEGEEEISVDENGDQFLDVSGDAESTKPKAEGTTKKPLDTAKLKKQTKKNKTGVVYFSTLPPYLKPFALKSLLEARGFSPITKVFLTPAVRAASAPGRRSNKRKTYSDGWVEFASKKTAKICAETLNAKIVGGRKGGWYHDGRAHLTFLKWNEPR
jgi:ESF2/ABP1 family protein